MRRLGVREADIEESFVRSQGPGGQNVNKVSTCVRLRHRPSGVEVKCSLRRSQAANRFFARVVLVRKIEELRNAQRSGIDHLRHTARQISRRRSIGSKSRLKEEKRRRTEKKMVRRRVDRFDV